MSANVYSKMCWWKGQQVYQNPSDIVVNVCDGVPIRVVDTETFLRMSENLLVEKETFRNHRTYEGSFETFH